MSSNDSQQSNQSSPSRVIRNTRTQSECSITSEDDENSGKRQRTTSQTYMVLGVTGASPPKFVSLEEIMQAANGMRDMALVHQIVVDKDFRLEKVEPEPDTIQGMVKHTVRKAFWDLLRSELGEDPPEYTQALILLEDIKQGLFSVLLPQHTKLKQEICEVLDSDLIRQQAEHGTLDFPRYAQFVISIMAKLCAPVRDEEIKQLTETTDVVQTFKGILETIDLMKLDMANFTLQMARPEIIAHSVELERKKFADFLAIQADGLEHTRKWLLKHLDSVELTPLQENGTYEDYIKSAVKKLLCRSCIDLLEWDENNPYPETFMLDHQRLLDLEYKTYRITIMGTILLVAMSSIGANLQSIAEFKSTLKKNLSVLLQPVNSDKDLPTVMPNVAEQLVSDIKQAQEKYQLPPVLTESNEKQFKDQFLDILKADHKVRSLVHQRVREFFLAIIESSTAAPQRVPTGLSLLQSELASIAGQFLRIVSHNSTVFCIYYYDIVAQALPAIP